MTHDPMCAMSWGCSNPHNAHHADQDHHFPCSHCGRECHCQIIRRVRADDLDRIESARVSASESFDPLDPRTFDILQAALQGISAAAALAAGNTWTSQL